MEIIFRKSSRTVKNPKHLKRNIFIIYSPKVVKIEPATGVKVDTELITLSPKNSKGFVSSIFRGDEINEFCSEKQLLWIKILNKSFKETVKIKKNEPLGFLVMEPENLSFKYETANKKKSAIQKKKSYWKRTNQKQKRQHGVFLNRYDFTYAGRDTVTQAAKVAPGITKTAANDTNAIATDRINQIIIQGCKELERVFPKILRGAIEVEYQTPFILLGNFGKQQLNKIKRKIMG